MKQKKFIYTTLIVLGATTLLTSCLAVKDYQQPEVKETALETYRTSNEKNIKENDSLSIGTLSWKELFTDPNLQKHIEQGLNNNFDLQIAIKQMQSAEAYLKQSKAGFFPTFTLGMNANDQKISSNSRFGAFSPGNIQSYELSGNLSWEADVWGKLRSNKRASFASFLKTSAAKQAVQSELVARIVKNYYQLLALDAQLKVTKQTIATRKKSVKTIKALKEAGQVTQVAVDQNIAQYNSAEALKIDIEATIFSLENSMSMLLGTSPKFIERGELKQQNIQADLEIGIPALLLENRPDIQQAQYALMENFELKNVAKTNLYPSLTLTASGGFQSLEVDNWISASSLFTNVIAGITQPIFNQRKLKTQLEIANNNEAQALLYYRKTLLTAGNEVSNALYTYQAETSKYKFRQKEAQALHRAEVNSEELLNNGYATYLDLLTARESALNAKLNLIDSKLQQLLTVVNLYKALGGGTH